MMSRLPAGSKYCDGYLSVNVELRIVLALGVVEARICVKEKEKQGKCEALLPRIEGCHAMSRGRLILRRGVSGTVTSVGVTPLLLHTLVGPTVVSARDKRQRTCCSSPDRNSTLSLRSYRAHLDQWCQIRSPACGFVQCASRPLRLAL